MMYNATEVMMMVFSSLTFLFLFLPIVLLLYVLCPAKLRNVLLLVVSLVFYMWGERIYVWILVISTVFDYANGLLIEYFRKKAKPGAAKTVLWISVIGNLGILGVFKYSDFFLRNINAVGFDIELLGLALPIGISFYTFQTMSYTIDVYRGLVSVQHNLLSFGMYVTMFPQLIAGPIVRYADVEADMAGRKFLPEEFAEGIGRFVLGLGKKVLLANQAGAVWELVKGSSSPTVIMAWFGAMMYAFQIYLDFSGYSDMAIGLGKMFGFHFPENFHYPYLAKSITEFWRRWHMTLGTWFREYLYIPLGGNRHGKAKQLRNLFLVWALTGFWHGAEWNFLLWGIYFFVLLAGEKFVYGSLLKKAPAAVAHLYALLFVLFGWVLFANESLTAVGDYLHSMFAGPLWSAETAYLLMTNGILFIVLAVGSTPLMSVTARKVREQLATRPVVLSVVRNVVFAGVFLVSVAFLLRDSYNPFLYFRF